MSTTITTALPPSVLRVADLGSRGLSAALDLAEELKEHPHRRRKELRGQTVACYFAKPSTRTRVSFETAAYRLGALPVMLRPDELQLGRGEPIADTARVLSSYCAAIVIRTFAQADVAELAAASSVPVINALTDDHHPCQALADLLTIRERFGELAGLKLAYVGDGNNVAHSLLEACALAGMHIAVAAPADRMPDADITAWAHATATQTGGSVTVVTDPAEAVAGASAVYTDVWVSMGEEAERDRKVAELAPYQIDGALMAHARPDAMFLHCLPAHRGEEVAANVIDGQQSAVWQQAANRLPTEQALLSLLTRRAGEAER
jgi:ornithine carbamoyltransferase